MNSRKGSFALLVSTAALMALLCVSVGRAAQGAPQQLVPNNLAPHPAPEQPIPYSHKLHVGTLHLQCQTCHTNVGAAMTIPTAAKCMTCHSVVAKDKPAIVKLAAYAKSGKPIPWVRVYKLTPGVTWTHKAHLQAGLQCQNCHGQVGQLVLMEQTTSVTSMGVCITCHEEHHAATVCSTCHVWPKAQYQAQATR